MSDFILIFLAIIALVAPILILVLYFKLMKEKPAESFDKLVDFFKWYIVSVVIVVAVKIIDTGIKDRELSMSEMSNFDRYLNIILLHDSLDHAADQNLKLARYFATIVPSEPLRERWKAFYDTLSRDKAERLLPLNAAYQLSQLIPITNDTLLPYLKKLNENSLKMTSELGIRTAWSDSIQNQIQEVEAFQILEQEKEDKLAMVSTSPNAMSKNGNYLVDVFYLASKPATQRQAKKIADKLNMQKFDTRVRKLSDLINSRSGYQIYTNQIRVEQNNKAEIDLGKEIQKIVGGSLTIRQVTQSSPRYISVFVVE